jgi:hypothetical protein
MGLWRKRDERYNRDPNRTKRKDVTCWQAFYRTRVSYYHMYGKKSQALSMSKDS